MRYTYTVKYVKEDKDNMIQISVMDNVTKKDYHIDSVWPKSPSNQQTQLAAILDLLMKFAN
jgi:hypothetical protein